MKNRLRFTATLLAVISLVLLFSACAPDNSGEDTLWIVTEESRIEDGMNWQTERIIRDFRKAYPDVKVTLEILPDEKEQAQERAVRLEKIRADILSGKGPDVYLLPNETLMNDPLFGDVQQAMRNGVFADISAYYDADEALGKEELVTEVMDGGIASGARYVLPLRYTFPVLYTERQLMGLAGLDLETASLDVHHLLRVLAAVHDPQWNWMPSVAASSGYAPYLPRMIDYDSGKVLINEAQISDLLRSFNDLFSEAVVPGFGMSAYIHEGTVFTEKQPIDMDWAHNAVQLSAISKAENQELVAIPVRAADGDLVACVTYYAAVGNGCSDPELAYAFLREFLTEEVQFEQERLKLSKYSAATSAIGLPVRSNGKAAELWTMYKKIHKNFGGDAEQARRRKAVMDVSLTQADVPILDVHVDRVCFVTSFDQQIMIPAVSKVLWEQADIDTVAKELIFQLQVHAAEG